MPDLLDRLRAIDSPTIANAIEIYKIRDRTEGFTGHDIRCLFPELGVMLGHAVTAVCTNQPGPVAGRKAFFQWLEAIEKAPKPVVCVFQDASPDPPTSCYFGEVMATCAKRLGAIGLITDGGVRDLHEARSLGFHYFAPGAVASHGNFAIVDVEVPVTVSGMTVRPGDLLHADLNGVVLIPSEIAEQLPDGVEQIRSRERRVLDYAASNDFNLRGLIDIMSH
jgi:regulator of RNase E activity RraA